MSACLHVSISVGAVAVVVTQNKKIENDKKNVKKNKSTIER